MSAISDLIAQIGDSRLRERLASEWSAATQAKKFGLVFEDHLPELVPLFGTRARRGDTVCRAGHPMIDLWVIKRVAGEVAHCAKRADATVLGSYPLGELVVIRQFGEPIFPALTPVDQVANGRSDDPWHALIEADNYHALQLLEYLYIGKVDCIYIDPPYNTGARDWKYNNDYIDENDAWRHSKWLAFMRRRLKLAKRLLKLNGVLIVTIDKNELHHLGMLLEDIFPATRRQVVTICITPSGTSGEGLSRVEEYGIFCFMGNAEPSAVADDMLLPMTEKRAKGIRWESLMRGGTSWYRKERDNLCYPIILDKTGSRIVGVGEPLPFHRNEKLDVEEERQRPTHSRGRPLAWPVRNDGRLGIWRVENKTLEQLVAAGYAYVSSRDESRGTWTIRYLMEGTVKAIDEGEIAVIGTGPQGEVQLKRTENKRTIAKTMWNRGRHTAGGAGGSALLVDILGRRNAFSFPKSIYATKDAIEVAVGDRPDALILDFFAGSGTTLNAVNLLNSADGGRRKCILVTNNEVSSAEADSLRAREVQPGSDEWERHGICRSVTWPRSKFSILGKRDDGTLPAGEYLTGRFTTVEKARNYQHISLFDREPTNAEKKQLLSLMGRLPQSLVNGPTPFITSVSHKTSIIFDISRAEEWLASLEESDSVDSIYIVAPTKNIYQELRERAFEILGSIQVLEELSQPISAGFSANLAYFRLEFLEKDRITLKRAFKEILPLLWLKAGAIGPRPNAGREADTQGWLLPQEGNFAVLLDEYKIAKFIKALAGRPRLHHAFIVTDSDEAFQVMSAELSETLKASGSEIRIWQLYRDYLSNFLINRRLDLTEQSSLEVNSLES